MTYLTCRPFTQEQTFRNPTLEVDLPARPPPPGRVRSQSPELELRFLWNKVKVPPRKGYREPLIRDPPRLESRREFSGLLPLRPVDPSGTAPPRPSLVPQSNGKQGRLFSVDSNGVREGQILTSFSVRSGGSDPRLVTALGSRSVSLSTLYHRETKVFKGRGVYDESHRPWVLDGKVETLRLLGWVRTRPTFTMGSSRPLTPQWQGTQTRTDTWALQEESGV